MDDDVRLFARLEFPGPARDWYSTEVDIEHYEVDGDDDWQAVFEEAWADGALEEPLEGTVSSLLKILKENPAWRVEKGKEHLNLARSIDDEDLGEVTNALAISLFYHAVAEAGARGYLYYDRDPSYSRWCRLRGVDGKVESFPPEYSLDQVGDNEAGQLRLSFRSHIQNRLYDAKQLWPVAEDAALDAQLTMFPEPEPFDDEE